LKTQQTLQLTKRSNQSWGSEDVEEKNDPFAEIEEDFSGDANDLEANLIRDKRATLCASVSNIVERLQPSKPLEDLKTACDELVCHRNR